MDPATSCQAFRGQGEGRERLASDLLSVDGWRRARRGGSGLQQGEQVLGDVVYGLGVGDA
jgi:hypothetical protein